MEEVEEEEEESFLFLGADQTPRLFSRLKRPLKM